MRFSSRFLSAGFALVCAALALPAAAHHSFATVYDMGTVTEIAGPITKIHWANPHIKIYVAASDGQTWEVEAGPVNLVSLRMKIEKSMLKTGDNVRVRGNPARSQARSLWVSNILLPDKTELLAAPDAQPYFRWGAVRTVGGGTIDPKPRPLRPGEKPSLFNIWSPRIPGFPRPRGEPVLTDAGRRAQARYASGKQVVADCEVPGMPFAMMSPYPIEIIQKGDRLLVRGEAYDLRRVVTLAKSATLPAPSPLGLSVGRIAGDELIVETSRINYHSYGDIGPAQSNQSRVVERFTLAADGLTLDYEITVTDPEMLGKPWLWGGSFVLGGAIRPWNCGVESK
jgi:hypothetical protein